MTPAKTQLLAGAYSLLGNSLQKSGLIDDHWNPIKRSKLDKEKLSSVDLEIVDLFRAVEREVLKHGVKAAERNAAQVADAIQALPEEERTANHVLTAVHMILIAVDGEVGPFAMMVTGKAQRIIDAVDPEVRKVADTTTATYSYRVADNIARKLQGRPILDGQLRDMRRRRFARWKKFAQNV